LLANFPISEESSLYAFLNKSIAFILSKAFQFFSYSIFDILHKFNITSALLLFIDLALFNNSSASFNFHSSILNHHLNQ
jgi:hypothetical protein